MESRKMNAANATKKINLKNTMKILSDLGANDVQKTLIRNNIILYNDELARYQDGNEKSAYFLYQVNGQIMNQIRELSKQIIYEKEDQLSDEFSQLVKSLKGAKTSKG